MQSRAPTVAEYLASLPEDRRKAIAAVRKVILKNLPSGAEETMQYGMITYVVPLSIYPTGYLGKKDTALPFVSLASQKNYMSVYLMNIYTAEGEAWFRKEYVATGKQLDMGKCCVRFRRLEDLALDVIGKAVARKSVKELITAFEKARGK